MNRKASDLKVLAREAMSGKYSTPIVAMIFMALITTAGTGLAGKLFGTEGTFSIVMTQVFTIVITLIVSIFEAGLSYMFLNICRGKNIEFSDIYYMFRHNPDRVIVVGIILTVIQYIAMLPYLIWIYTKEPLMVSDTTDISLVFTELGILMFLLALGGVVDEILALPFVMCYYLLVDDPEMGAMEAIKGSMAMMKGNYGRLIRLLLSFLGLYILGIFSCYIALLWIEPYMNAAVTEFYLELRGELDNREQHYRSVPENSQVVYQQGNDEQQSQREPDDYNAEA